MMCGGERVEWLIQWGQVLDPRTRMILFKMLNQNVITEINGCISTGKEANVYHALTPDGGEAAIKVAIQMD